MIIMASPQLEHGYIRIANELLEELIRIRIPGVAMQLLLVIFRKTYGFNKTTDQISLSQFAKATSLKKPHIVRNLKVLENMSLIIITNKDNKVAKTYRINKDYTKWNPLPKKITLPKKIITVINNDNFSLPLLGTTKDNTTKNNITKDNDSDRMDLLEIKKLFEETYRRSAEGKMIISKLHTIMDKYKPVDIRFAFSQAAKATAKHLNYVSKVLQNKNFEDEAKKCVEEFSYNPINLLIEYDHFRRTLELDHKSAMDMFGNPEDDRRKKLVQALRERNMTSDILCNNYGSNNESKILISEIESISCIN